MGLFLKRPLSLIFQQLINIFRENIAKLSPLWDIKLVELFDKF